MIGPSITGLPPLLLSGLRCGQRRPWRSTYILIHRNNNRSFCHILDISNTWILRENRHHIVTLNWSLSVRLFSRPPLLGAPHLPKPEPTS